MCVGVEKLFFKHYMHLYYASVLAIESKPILEELQHQHFSIILPGKNIYKLSFSYICLRVGTTIFKHNMI